MTVGEAVTLPRRDASEITATLSPDQRGVVTPRKLALEDSSTAGSQLFRPSRPVTPGMRSTAVSSSHQLMNGQGRSAGSALPVLFYGLFTPHSSLLYSVTLELQDTLCIQTNQNVQAGPRISTILATFRLVR